MNLYEILEINQNASEREIKKAYHRLALIYHPDKNSDLKAKEKFQSIQSAYNILIDQKTRIDYCNLNGIEQNNFVNLLQKIFQNSLVIDEIKHFGINFEKKDWTYLEKNFNSLFVALNFKELLFFFKNGKFPKKKIDTNLTVSETDNEEFIDNAESYFDLPVYYQKINNLDIHLNLNISLDDLIKNNKKKIKIKRNINDTIICNTFIFNTDKPNIVFPNCGDLDYENYGSLIIKLNLPTNFYWNEKIIIIEQPMSLYELIYGIDINLQLGEQLIKIPKWIPSRDGFYIDINQIKIKNYILNIKLILNYDDSEEKKQILFSHFS
jgi:curved DNA-binding protein CbpA